MEIFKETAQQFTDWAERVGTQGQSSSSQMKQEVTAKKGVSQSHQSAC